LIRPHETLKSLFPRIFDHLQQTYERYPEQFGGLNWIKEIKNSKKKNIKAEGDLSRLMVSTHKKRNVPGKYCWSGMNNNNSNKNYFPIAGDHPDNSINNKIHILFNDGTVQSYSKNTDNINMFYGDNDLLKCSFGTE